MVMEGFQICRVCLKQSQRAGSLHEVKLQQQLQVCRSGHLDPLCFPKALCSTCLDELTRAASFVLQLQASDKLLNQAILQPYSDLEDTNGVRYTLFNNDVQITPTNTKIDPECKKKFQCSECEQTTTSKSAMLTHIRKHTGEKPFACFFCKTSYTQKATLQSHIRRRHSLDESIKKPFICNTCGRRFSGKSELITHLRSHTGEAPYRCKICQRSFTQNSSLIRHQKIHTGEKSFMCYLCGKSFSDATKLKKHSNVHSDAKNFTCNLCGKAVKSKNSLIKHMITHDERKGYVCNQCGAILSSDVGLRVHLEKIHSETSGYCSLCKKRFGNIEIHMRRHNTMPRNEDSQIFKCDREDCVKTFPKQHLLNQHISKYHTNVKPLNCTFCSAIFYRDNHIRKHLMRYHRKEIH